MFMIQFIKLVADNNRYGLFTVLIVIIGEERGARPCVSHLGFLKSEFHPAS